MTAETLAAELEVTFDDAQCILDTLSAMADQYLDSLSLEEVEN